MQRNTRSFRTLLIFAVLFSTMFSLGAGETERPIEYLFPQSTLAGLALPDLGEARKALASSRLGEIYKQPDMRAFLDPVLKQMNAGYEGLRAANPAVPALDVLDRALLNGELAISIFRRPNDNEPGIFVSIKPKDAAAFEELLKPFLNGQPLTADVPIPLGEGDAAPGVIYTHGRLLLCKPMSELISISTRVADKGEEHQGSLAADPGFKAVKAQIKSSAAWLFVNPPELLDLAIADAKAKGNTPELKGVIDALGLGSATALALNLDFSGPEPAADFIVCKQGDAGIFALLSSRAMNKDLLKIASLDSPYVSAGSFPSSEVIPLIRKVLQVAAPNDIAKFDDALKTFARYIGFDIQKDLLENIEPAVVFAQTPLGTAGPLSFQPGLVALAHLKNSAKVASSIEKAFTVASVLGGPQLPPVIFKLAQTTYKGAKIYYFTQIGSTHALTVVKEYLIYGTSVNAVKRGLDQLENSANILANKDFQSALARVSGQPFNADKLPASFQYSVDKGSGGGTLITTMLGLAAGTAIIAGAAEGLAHGKLLDFPVLPPMLANIPQVGEVARHPAAGVAMPVLNALDFENWPDEAFFAQYRASRASVGMGDEKGWHMRTDFPPPSPQYNLGTISTIGVIAVATSLVLPVLGRARESAKRVASASNLSQIAKACIMYNNENNKMPTSGAELYPKFINDVRVFQSARHPESPVGFTLLVGVDMDMNQAVLAYETDGSGGGRNVVFCAGNVEFEDEATFERNMEMTQELVKKAGHTLQKVPLTTTAENKAF